MFWRIGIVTLVVALAGCQCPLGKEAPVARAPVAVGDQVNLMGIIDGVPAGGESPDTVTQLRQHSYQTVGNITDPSVDSTGKWMVFSSTAHSLRPDIFIKAVDGKTVTQLTTDSASDIQPAFSPDGRYVAFASNRSGVWEVYVMTMDGKSVQQITQGGGQNLHPSWSPDAQHLVYCCQSSRSGQWELWIADMANPAGRQLVGQGLFPVWSPKDDVIAFQRARGRGDRLYGIWTIRLDKSSGRGMGEPTLPTLVASSGDHAYVGPSFSADGLALAFSAVDLANEAQAAPAEADIFAVEVTGENLRRLTEGPGKKFSPTWADNRIFFCCDRGGYENIWSVQADSTGQGPMIETVLGANTGDAIAQP